MKLNNINWTIKEYDELIQYLREISDENYKKFHKSLVPGLDNMIGVQIPKLRVIAKEIVKGNYNEYLSLVENKYYEETMIQGLVIGYIKTDYIDTLKLIRNFLPHITNWAICDSFCKRFESVIENKKDFLKFLIECIESDKEYYIRFAIVMLKIIYIEEGYVDTILNNLDNIHHDGYYVKMAIAWTLCECFIKFEDKTMSYLNVNKLDNFTYNKTLQKIVESNRVGKGTKNLIYQMKRK